MQNVFSSPNWKNTLPSSFSELGWTNETAPFVTSRRKRHSRSWKLGSTPTLLLLWSFAFTVHHRCHRVNFNQKRYKGVRNLFSSVSKIMPHLYIKNIHTRVIDSTRLVFSDCRCREISVLIRSINVLFSSVINEKIRVKLREILQITQNQKKWREFCMNNFK